MLVECAGAFGPRGRAAPDGATSAVEGPTGLKGALTIAAAALAHAWDDHK